MPAARLSAQVIAFARGAPPASTGKQLCIAPLNEIPVGATGVAAATARSVRVTASRMTRTSCSAQPGRGTRSG